MKNFKFLSGLFLLFLTLACTNEPVDPNIVINNQTCSEPTSFQVSNFINNNSVSLSWVAGGTETSWTVQYGIQGFALGTGTTVVSSNTVTTITGLNSSNSYSFYVKANCTSSSSSQWVGPVTVQAIATNPNCNNPANLTAVRNATLNTNVDLAWTAGGTETSWEIQYGISGFSVGTGTIVTSTTLTKQVSNISATSSYDFYVRAKCSATESSAWLGPIVLNSVGGTVSGDYWPAALNNQWVYKKNGVLQSPMKMISVDNINNSTYYTFDTVFGESTTSGAVGTATERLKKVSGDYFIKVEQVTIDYGNNITGIVSGIEYTILKDYLNVGESWTGTYSQTTTFNSSQIPSVSQTTNYTGTVMEKNSTITVGSTTYSNIIKIRINFVTGTGASSSSYYSDYWFSKNIGLVKYATTSGGSGTTTVTSFDLDSYILN